MIRINVRFVLGTGFIIRICSYETTSHEIIRLFVLARSIYRSPRRVAQRRVASHAPRPVPTVPFSSPRVADPPLTLPPSFPSCPSSSSSRRVSLFLFSPLLSFPLLSSRRWSPSRGGARSCRNSHSYPIFPGSSLPRARKFHGTRVGNSMSKRASIPGYSSSNRIPLVGFTRRRRRGFLGPGTDHRRRIPLMRQR